MTPPLRGCTLVPVSLAVLVCLPFLSCGPAHLPSHDEGEPVSDQPCRFEPIPFDFDRSEVGPIGLELLKKNAECAQLLGKPLMVMGHTDSRGTQEYNMHKGLAMAQAVCARLVQLGVTVPLRAVSMGEEKPACTQATEACRRMNRRVVITEDPGQ